MHFSAGIHANGDDPETEGFFTTIFHQAVHFQTGTAHLSRQFWECCCSRCPEHRAENTDSTVFSPFFFKTPFLVFSRLVVHITHRLQTIPKKATTRGFSPCLHKQELPWGHRLQPIFGCGQSHTRPPLMRAGLERTSKAPMVTSQGLGSQSWSVSQDILDHPVFAGLGGGDALKATWGGKE